MSVSKMEKLTAVVPQEAAEVLLRRLMRLRAVSVIDPPEEKSEPPLQADVTGAAERAARVEAVLPTLSKYSTRKKPLLASQLRVSHAEFCADGRYDVAWRAVKETEKLLAKQKELQAERDALLSRMQSYLPYLDYPRRLDFEGTEKTVMVLGVLPGGTDPETVMEALEGRATVVQLIGEESSGLYLAVLSHKKEQEKVMAALSGIGFLHATFPEKNGTAKALFDRLDRERERVDKALEGLQTRLSSLAERIEEVEILSDVEHTTLLAERQKEQLATTKKCAVLCCWCPVFQKTRVTAMLEKTGAAYEFCVPAEDEDVPVLMHNNRFARNFEWVVGMYAYPKYGGFDPTFIMSIFYMIIFGLMFADAGYGLVLSVVCFSAVRIFRPREKMQRFLMMFGYCGIPCILFGVLFGSYFGNFPIAFLENFLGRAPETLPRLSLLPSEAANVAILFDPLQNPMGFLIVSLGAGAVHLLAGMAVQAFVLIRRGKVLDALFDVGSYWVLFAGFAFLALKPDVGIWLTLGGAGAILLTQGRSKKGIMGKVVGGFGGLYGLINYMSDLLSYSRILALGLAASVIGQVVNILATLKGASFVGFIMMIVIFIFGHLLNLVINVLGTFVHTARLQYIEFFGKFYESGGTPFEPIGAADKYTEDVTEEPSDVTLSHQS